MIINIEVHELQILNSWTRYSTRGPDTQPVDQILNQCTRYSTPRTRYSTSAPDTQPVHQILNQCTRYSTSAPDTQPVHQILNQCTRYSTSAPDTQPVHQILNQCTRYSTSAPDTQPVYPIFNGKKGENALSEADEHQNMLGISGYRLPQWRVRGMRHACYQSAALKAQHRQGEGTDNQLKTSNKSMDLCYQ